MPIQDQTFIQIIWGIVVAIYTGITGHQYFRLNKLEDKIDSNQDKIEDIHVSKEIFQAHMDTIQVALNA